MATYESSLPAGTASEESGLVGYMPDYQDDELFWIDSEAADPTAFVSWFDGEGSGVPFVRWNVSELTTSVEYESGL